MSPNEMKLWNSVKNDSLKNEQLSGEYTFMVMNVIYLKDTKYMVYKMLLNNLHHLTLMKIYHTILHDIVWVSLVLVSILFNSIISGIFVSSRIKVHVFRSKEL